MVIGVVIVGVVAVVAVVAVGVVVGVVVVDVTVLVDAVDGVLCACWCLLLPPMSLMPLWWLLLSWRLLL